MYGWSWRDKLAAVVDRGGLDDCWPASRASIDQDGYAHLMATDTPETLVHRMAVIVLGGGHTGTSEEEFPASVGSADANGIYYRAESAAHPQTIFDQYGAPPSTLSESKILASGRANGWEVFGGQAFAICAR